MLPSAFFIFTLFVRMVAFPFVLLFFPAVFRFLDFRVVFLLVVPFLDDLFLLLVLVFLDVDEVFFTLLCIPLVPG